MFTFCIENHEPFGTLTKNCPKLDKNKSIVTRLSVFVVYKSAVSIRTFQKSNCAGCLNICICTSISWYFNKIDQTAISDLEKISATLFFHKITVEVSRNKCAKRHKDWKFPLIYFRHLKVGCVKAYQISCLFIFTSIYPLTRLKGLAVECIRRKDYWTDSNGRLVHK